MVAALLSLTAGSRLAWSKSSGRPITCSASANGGAIPNRIVVVDRTTAFGQDTREAVIAAVTEWAVPGDTFMVVRFGGVLRDLLGRIVRVPITGITAETAQKSRWTKSPKDLERGKACAEQSRAKLAEELRSAMSEYDGSPAGVSPIFEVLAAIADEWQGQDQSRTCLICSDGVQHSANLSFFRNGREGGLNIPKPATLERRLRDLGLMPPRFNGIAAVHIGFGSGDGPAQSKRQRSQAELLALKRVWSEGYWQAVKARYFTFGTPLPLSGFNPPAQAIPSGMARRDLLGR
jgi:hypothetical protein